MFRKFICKKKNTLVSLFLLLELGCLAQNKNQLKGTVISKFTQEPLAFASIYWKLSGVGCLTDSMGKFSISSSNAPSDTLLVSYIGYNTMRLSPVEPGSNGELVIQLETATREGIEVKAKYNKGLLWWKNIIAHKRENAPQYYRSYYCELYNKIEIDLANINRSRMEKSLLLRPFATALKNIDTTAEEKPFLPVFLTESVSDYYAATNPDNVKEVIKAVQTSGIKNESVMEYLGGTSQKINAYHDYMTIFGREFISPVSTVGNRYYDYKGLDTQLIRGEKYLHLRFTPKREGENLFTGDCWIHHDSWALLKINLFISNTANINFVKRLSVLQEFSRQDSGQWIVAKEKLVVELSPLGPNNTTVIGRKTAIYQHVKVNQPFITEKLMANKRKEEVEISAGATKQVNAQWQTLRPEPLSKNEQHALTLVDTLNAQPEFNTFRNTVTFLLDGHKKFGKIEIGPWYKWISMNPVEGIRPRFDIGTTSEFSRQWRLYGYLAYGTRDKTWKGKAAVSYDLPDNHGWNVQASYKSDFDNRQRGFNGEEAALDNIFGGFIRRPGMPVRFLHENEAKLIITKTFPNSLSFQGSMSRTDYKTLQPLPPLHWFTADGKKIANMEFQMKARYAPGEKTIHGHRKDRRIRSDQPITELVYTAGASGILGSQYDYQKLSASISQRFRIPRWGQVSYMLYGGKIFGEQLPFMLLQVHPGNETYYYNKNAFSLMNKYEFISDSYAGFNLEHNFEKKLINLVPFMRRSNMRQFWNIKSVTGNLSTAHRDFNHIENATGSMRTLNSKYYVELGTGVDNIFKFFRVDLVWRLSPQTPPGMQNFGVFGSFRLQF